MTSNGARLDAVEIKVTLSGSGADDATTVFGLAGGGDRRRVYFFEDLRGRDPAALPLLDAGVILRLRRAEDGDDTTVKLRPCDRARLTRDCLAMKEDGKHRFRLEADWAGDRRVLAASMVAPLDDDRLDDVLAGRAAARTLFSKRHRRLLSDSAGIDVDLDGLTLLGPVKARKWESVRWEGFSVTVERWVVEPLDFLELSLRVEPDRAEETQERFTSALRRNSVEGDSKQETKTRQVLTRLAADN